MTEQPETPDQQPAPAGGEAGVEAEAAATAEPWVTGTPVTGTPLAAEPQVPDFSTTTSTASTSGFSSDGGASTNERPELAVGAAFASGFLLAMVLKRLAR